MSKGTGVPNASSFYGYYRIETTLDLRTDTVGSGPISATQKCVILNKWYNFSEPQVPGVSVTKMLIMPISQLC